MSNTLKISSYNCKNYKSNQLEVENLITTNHITYITEHWLDVKEEYLLNKFKANYNIFFHSDYDNHINRYGRPKGGNCWFFDKELSIISFEKFNNSVSKIRIRDDKNGFIDIYGVWLQYDDKSDERLCEFQSNLSLIAGQMKNICYKNSLIIGDFNASFERQNRFDIILSEFIRKRKLSDCFKLFKQQKNKTTYVNGDYKSKIDHILVDCSLKKRIKDYHISDIRPGTSDHASISLTVNEYTNISAETQNKFDSHRMHKFNWKDPSFKNDYSKITVNTIETDSTNFCYDSTLGDTMNVDSNLKRLSKIFIKCSRFAEKNQMKKDNSIKRKKVKIKSDPEVYAIINQIENLKLLEETCNVKNTFRKAKLKKLNTELRRLQRQKLFTKEKKDSLKLENHLDKDKNEFWQTIKNFRSKCNQSNSLANDINISDFAEYYSNLFSHHDRPSNEDQVKIEEEVKFHFDSLKENLPNELAFSLYDIDQIIKKLKNNKASGFDFITNEMIKNAMCPELIKIFHHIFNYMYKTGYTPCNFNISLVTPIPKKGELYTPSDYRPISVSTTYAMIYERLLLQNLTINHLISSNQFGYKNKTSSKHAYYLVNEAIRYYNRSKIPLFCVSLDCQKAFDKVWRAGIFHKLIGKIDNFTWRAIYSYYNQSMIIVKLNGLMSTCYKTSEGCKQGGVLSSFLFNFFINGMLEECLDSNLGAKIGRTNLSIIAYCDDVILLSPTMNHLNKLLDICFKYSIKWKLQYNQKKSVFLRFGDSSGIMSLPTMNDVPIEMQQNMIYLGLPLGDDQFIHDFFNKQMSKCEKSLYSLYGLGCKPLCLNPKVTAFIYKQFSQSIFRHGIDMLSISATHLKQLDIRQNILIKQTIGLSRFCKTSPLNDALKLDSITNIYLKHKIFFLRQIKEIKITSEVFSYLSSFYNKLNSHKHSFNNQINIVKKRTGLNNCLNTEKAIEIICNQSLNSNRGLVDSIIFTIDFYSNNRQFHQMINHLKTLLNYEFYV